MKPKFFLSQFAYIVAVMLSIFLLFFVIVCLWIGYDVKSQCKTAQRIYNQNCTQSLMSLLDDDKQTFRSRNSAIWALGQLGDQQALTILEKYYTGQIPEREPLDQMISQYELKKAIALAKGNFNLSAIIWRNDLIGRSLK